MAATRSYAYMADSDEDYYLPLQDQRVFGAGIKRKKINFIPASTSESPLPTSSQKNDIGSRYLSIVLPKSTSQSPNGTPTTTPGVSGQASDQPSDQTAEEAPRQHLGQPSTSADLCPICALPLSTPSTHESSLPHQLCLQHVHPPSHLPREHIGLRYLTTHGWDPDSRLGLGALQEGITVPIKARDKQDTAGLREQENEDEVARKKKDVKRESKEKIVRLDARELRKRDGEARKRAAMLRANFYGPDLEKYLGPNT